jgi:hypothetical protein
MHFTANLLTALFTVAINPLSISIAVVFPLIPILISAVRAFDIYCIFCVMFHGVSLLNNRAQQGDAAERVIGWVYDWPCALAPAC